MSVVFIANPPPPVLTPWDKHADCPLCTHSGGELIWQNDALRVILVDEPNFAGFTRVVWQAHISEMTDLPPAQRAQLMKTVFLVEDIMRRTLSPTKINLASLGNVTPHLHWHIIPRYHNDVCYPQPVWAVPDGAKQANGVTTEQLTLYVQALRVALWDN